MKIYRLSFGCSDESGNSDGCGTLLEWYSSEAGAKKRLAGMRRAKELDDTVPTEVKPFEIEPTRDGILAFLNFHVTNDNG